MRVVLSLFGNELWDQLFCSAQRTVLQVRSIYILYYKFNNLFSLWSSSPGE